MHVITMTTSLSKRHCFCTGNEKNKNKKNHNNFNIVEINGDQWIQNGYSGLNHEMHILDDNQLGRKITLKTIFPKGMIKISQNK